ncbi:Amino-acid acetyltransferase [Balamuthia mandrillaris]
MQEEVEIRHAKAEERAAVAALVIQNHLALSEDSAEEWLEQLKDVPSDFAHLMQDSSFAEGRHQVAIDKHSGAIVGCACIAPTEEEGVWLLEALSVRPSWRGRGLGKRLLRLAIDEARRVGAQRLKLVTLKERMENAWRLYQKQGFKRVSEEVVAGPPSRPLMTVLRYQLDLGSS